METIKPIVIHPDDVVLLRSRCKLRNETMEEIAEWYREHMGLKVKIINAEFEIEGIERDG